MPHCSSKQNSSHAHHGIGRVLEGGCKAAAHPTVVPAGQVHVLQAAAAGCWSQPALLLCRSLPLPLLLTQPALHKGQELALPQLRHVLSPLKHLEQQCSKAQRLGAGWVQRLGRSVAQSSAHTQRKLLHQAAPAADASQSKDPGHRPLQGPPLPHLQAPARHIHYMGGPGLEAIKNVGGLQAHGEGRDGGMRGRVKPAERQGH